MKQQYERRDLYVEISERIIARIEETGSLPWIRPWDPEKAAGPQAPFNPTTGKAYRGINSLLLSMDARLYETGDPRYVTFIQAKEAGWSVRKGEKALPIIFYKPLEVTDRRSDATEDDSPATRMIGMLRSYSVFHASQIDGIPEHVPPRPEDCPWDKPEAPFAILKNMGVKVVERGEKAFYAPLLDVVGLPPTAAFKGPEYLASTALHEAAHATGHATRMNRNMSGTFGSTLYAVEEVRVDTASAMACGMLQIPVDIDSHAAYIGTWLKKAKSDKRELFHMAADAQKISDYMLSHHPDFALKPETEEAPKPLDHVLPASALPRPAARTEQPAI